MVEELDGMDAVFHALAYGARRGMLGRLADGRADCRRAGRAADDVAGSSVEMAVDQAA